MDMALKEYKDMQVQTGDSLRNLGVGSMGLGGELGMPLDGKGEDRVKEGDYRNEEVGRKFGGGGKDIASHEGKFLRRGMKPAGDGYKRNVTDLYKSRGLGTINEY